ncbi:two-component system sensor histidine kinase YesM [Paenibacillus taihuensis]|uniref:Two-component system sensor histidine kinase YesM n=1 Tax=Paenibacillus taihuensis TaxID=1156355 RepID=A0A3D9S275_9BACL|nr:sensor histidine kinase [Paenibacillus taihuensis]REE86544.1 two-component system sensor histidine kinase YesM [Paenibacillus taihuensis]
MFRKFRIGLAQKMIIGYIVIILLPTLLIGSFYYKQMHNNAVKDYATNREYLIQQVGSTFLMNLSQIEMIHDMFQTNRTLSGLLSGKYTTASDQVYVYLKDLVPLFAFYKNSSTYIDRIRVYKLNPDVLNLGASIVDSASTIAPEVDKLKLGEGYWLQQIVDNSPDALQLTYYKKLYNEDFTQEIGVLEIRLKQNFVSSLLHSNDPNGANAHYFYVTDKNNVLGTNLITVSNPAIPLSDDDEEQILSSIKMPQPYQYFEASSGELLMNKFEVPKMAATIMALTPTDELFQRTNSLVRWYVLVIAVLLIILSGAYFFIFSTLVQRILKLGRHMRKNLLTRYDEDRGSDEVAFLVSSYNAMVSHNDEMMRKINVSQLRQKEAAYLALQAQINPHFIYNGLEAIRMAAEENDDPDVAKMLYALGQSIRYSLSRSNHARLKDELSHIRSYLEIYKVRMEERLQYDIVVRDETLLLRECPRFIIQPLVENAIIHGISKCSKTGMLHIEAWLEGDLAIVEIRDNGVGMTPEQLDMMRRKLDGEIGPPESDKPGGIGVMNVHERMISQFGPAYGLQITSELGEGTTVTLHIPRKGEST